MKKQLTKLFAALTALIELGIKTAEHQLASQEDDDKLDRYELEAQREADKEERLEERREDQYQKYIAEYGEDVVTEVVAMSGDRGPNAADFRRQCIKVIQLKTKTEALKKGEEVDVY